MISGTTTLHGDAVDAVGTVDAAAVLAAARGARAAANAAEARVLAAAVEWAHLHPAADLDDAATWWSGSKTMGRDTGIPIAGPGCPLVSEFAVAEFATTLGLSQESGRRLVGEALELAHRLPRLWARVQSGSLAPWRARRVAEQTLHLPPEAAEWVDAQVAPFAHKTGPAQTQRLVDEAIARHLPEYAAEVRDRAAEQRYLTIEHQQVSFSGTSRVHGELDLPDALDLEDASSTAPPSSPRWAPPRTSTSAAPRRWGCSPAANRPCRWNPGRIQPPKVVSRWFLRCEEPATSLEGLASLAPQPPQTAPTPPPTGAR